MMNRYLLKDPNPGASVLDTISQHQVGHELVSLSFLLVSWMVFFVETPPTCSMITPCIDCRPPENVSFCFGRWCWFSSGWSSQIFHDRIHTHFICSWRSNFRFNEKGACDLCFSVCAAVWHSICICKGCGKCEKQFNDVHPPQPCTHAPYVR